MTSAAIAMDGTGTLAFAKSESRAVGMCGAFMGKCHDNALRIVSAMKLASIGLIGISGNSFLMAASAFFVITQLIGMAYGTREHQQKITNEGAGLAHEDISALGKVLKPSQYPVESKAGTAALGEVLHGAYGAQMIASNGLNSGISIVVAAIFAFAGCLTLLFGKEAEKEKNPSREKDASLVFHRSTSKPVGFFSCIKHYMKDHPVQTASALMIVGGIVSIAGTLAISGGVVPAWYIAGMSLGLASNIFQGIFVTKKDFDIETAQEHKPISHVERLTRQRARGNDSGLCLA